MKSLIPVQKTLKAFQTLSRIAMIASFAVCGLALTGLLCAIVWYNGGKVHGADMDAAMRLTEANSLYQMIGALLSDAVFAVTDGSLFLFAYLYFKAEQADGTPFTYSGADRLRGLGIKTIVMPMVAAIISAVIYGCLDTNNPADWSGAISIAPGILLILASLVFRYGAELEMNIQEIGK